MVWFTLATVAGHEALDLTRHWVGYASLLIFLAAYTAVVLENKIHLRKSKPVVLAAGLIWLFVGIAYAMSGDKTSAAEAIRHDLSNYAELLLFLLVAMTYVNTMEERDVFDALRGWMVRKQLSLNAIFWMTGVIAFFLSSVLDNLTTALVMGTVVITAGRHSPKFQALGCINIVVAANAGGAFCPFGDITSLMVWQAGKLPFLAFFALFVPALVNWIVPATIMSFAVPRDAGTSGDTAEVHIKRGGLVVAGLFALTIVIAVSMYQLLAIPPVMGMMTGLGLLYFYGYYLKLEGQVDASSGPLEVIEKDNGNGGGFDIFQILRRAEWDTLMFFYGIVMGIGGLATIGYLDNLSVFLYQGLGTIPANVSVGVISAIVDNIPVMFSVLKMSPDMNEAQWQLVTLTTGVGGSIFSVGSAAGVALMGQARGTYTFESHLKWSWAIILGYVLSIATHLLLNGR
jgi:Na+/H+ antiporter NhaD/arsenite permease-like protein